MKRKEIKMEVEQKKFSRLHKREVCRFWMRDACSKGEACEFLHEMVATAMPQCRFNPCERADCPYNHTLVASKTLCPNYQAGFCSFGSTCKDRHDFIDGPPPGIALLFLKDDEVKLNTARRASTQKTFRRDDCPYFKSDGWCPYFYGCAFKH
jgi:hypothetical protein